MINKDGGGTIFGFYGRDTAVMRETHRDHGGSPSPPPPTREDSDHWPSEKNFTCNLGYWSVIFQTFLPQEAAPKNSWVFTWSDLHFLEGGYFTTTLISLRKFANISFVSKFMQLIIPLLFYHFFLSHHIISTNFFSDPHAKLDPSVLQKSESLSSW